MMLLFFFLCFAAAAAGKQPRGNRGFGRSTAQTDATPLSVAGLLHLAHGEDIPGHLADEDHSAIIREIDQLRQVLEGQPQGEQGLPPGNASCQTDAQGLLGWQLAQLRQHEPDAETGQAGSSSDPAPHTDTVHRGAGRPQPGRAPGTC